MSKAITFLLQVSKQLRALALTEPEIGANLRQIADQMETTAVQLRDKDAVENLAPRQPVPTK